MQDGVYFTQPCEGETLFEDEVLGDCGVYHAALFIKYS